MPGHDIIVIGASAGGVEALITLTSTLPPDLRATIFIVLHISPQSPSLLPDILKRAGKLEVVQPINEMRIRHSYIYVAPPDHHMIVEKGRVCAVRGPKENRHRPAIDPLFRSAALAYGPRVIGVVLTGSLDDGTAGLLAIKQHGGITVVQDPKEALYPSMPLHALANVEVDYTLPLVGIGALLPRLVQEPVSKEEYQGKSEEMEKEIKVTSMDTSDTQLTPTAGIPSVFSCPECGGVLREISDGDLLRFRCRVGHAFSIASLLEQQSEVIEDALWVALRTLEENVDLSQRMAEQANQREQPWLARRFEGKAQSAKQRIAFIRKALLLIEEAIDTSELAVKDKSNKPKDKANESRES
jgi:two-component system chemotaxis response regulator CheB